MGCFDCDELQFHYSEGCDACIDSLVNFVPGGYEPPGGKKRIGSLRFGKKRRDEFYPHKRGGGCSTIKKREVKKRGEGRGRKNRGEGRSYRACLRVNVVL